VDPEIGAQIYPWIFWENRRIRGVEAARILIEQQQKGLEMLTARGILVKVNSVMIPGVNDQHLKEVSKVVKAKGAFLHNVMPLIAEAEHGTYYGLMEQPSPTPEELQALQDECGGDMAMMRHCRQCRADAVGLLGEDRGAEFTLDKLEDMHVDYEAAMQTRQEVRENLLEQLAAKRAGGAPARPAGVAADSRPVLMAVAAKNGVVSEHFGHAREFLVYEASPTGVRLMGHRKVDLYCNGATDCGDSGEGGQPAGSILDQIIHALSGCEQVLCARIGFEPWGQLEAAGIQPNGEHAMEPVEDAVLAVYQEMAAAGKLAAPVSKLDKVA
jgi:nitrogen fixation protein NifB